jgi:hypothetical protein
MQMAHFLYWTSLWMGAVAGRKATSARSLGLAIAAYVRVIAA